MSARSFPDAADGRPMPPMAYELMAAGLGEDDARFVARVLRQEGYYLVRSEDIGWEDIDRFRAELRKGHDVREDAGGFFVRAIMALFGKTPDPVLTYQRAAEAMLREMSQP